MKHRKKAKKFFGEKDPKFVSSRMMARLVAVNICYDPHDQDVYNASTQWDKDTRCWKRYRKNQYRQAA